MKRVHVALEYQREGGRNKDRYVAHLARPLDALEDEGCQADVSVR